MTANRRRPSLLRFNEMPMEIVRDGLSRTAVRGDGSLVTINWFEPGYRSTGQHQHDCDQLAFVLSGQLRFVVGDEVIDVVAPAVLHIPGGVPHGAEPVGDERVLNMDVFAPPREDYLYLAAHQGVDVPAEGESA